MRSGCFTVQFSVHKLIQTMLILLVVSPTLAGYSWEREAADAAAEAVAGARSNPQFEIQPSSRRLAVLAGQTALLPCVVRNLGDKVVSWIRNRDLHILTSGIFIFTSDLRFEVVHKPNIDFWGLKIKNTHLSDSGKYECQVNTDPKMNYAIQLTVTDSHMHDSPVDESGTATIQGPRLQPVRAGSTITFTCVVSRAAPASHASRAQLKWTHAGRDVTFQSSRGGISIDTDYRSEQITSRLTVALVQPEDAGAYTCHDVDVKPDTVTLSVVEGERSEAMQRNPPSSGAGSATSALSCRNSLLPLLFVYFNWILSWN